MQAKNVVYLIPCDTCRVRYVGETGQHFCDRRSKHQRDVKNKKPSNGLYAHLKENKGHKINWEDFVYLDSEGIGNEGKSRRPYTSMQLILHRRWAQTKFEFGERIRSRSSLEWF